MRYGRHGRTQIESKHGDGVWCCSASLVCYGVYSRLGMEEINKRVYH